ncbi:MAG: VCBS repeat-containing protein, partial [Desulfofustis sp.]|nr:VCBS repeat-containing protein [Desulfofustis sp.]
MRLFIIVLASLVWLGQGNLSASAEEKTAQDVFILPLEISRTGQYAYLNDVIGQMLITRLSRQEHINVLSSELSKKQIASLKEFLASGNYSKAVAELRADWLVEGSMYSLKEGLQVNLTLYPAAADRKPLSFGFTASGGNDVMPAIDRLSGEIQGAIVAGDGTGAKEQAGAVADDGLSGFQTPHPERAYKKGLYAGATLFGGAGDDRFESKGVRKSSTIPINVESVSLGDLNGDGVNELVVASRSKIRVFHFDDRRFRIVAEYNFSPRIKIHAITIADPFKTGSMKLFVSADEGKYAASAVLSWDGTDSLQLQQRDLRWYIRPLWWPKKGMILAGQQVSPNISDNFLAPGVFELSIAPDGSGLVRGDKLLLPEKTNLFDFVVADLNGDGVEEMMVIDRQQKLLVYDDAQNLIWVSSANYGGSKTFFGPPISEDGRLSGGYTAEQQSRRRLVFIPGRMEVKDITGDGLPEV